MNDSLLLTQEDVHRLMHNPSPEVLALVAEKILHYYNSSQFTPAQIALAEDIFNILVKNIHVIVRKVMSDHLCSNINVPHELILKLAQDNTEEVSTPILQNSEVLTDEDLVMIINTTSEIAHQIAIAKRKKVSEIVADALTNTKDEAVITQLLQNVNAAISNDTLATIRTEFSESSTVLDSLSKREFIPDDASLAPVAALFMKDLAFLETTLAELGQMPKLNARVLLRKPDGSGFKFIYEKIGFPLPLFDAAHLVFTLFMETEITQKPLSFMEIITRAKQHHTQTPIAHLSALLEFMEKNSST